MHLSGVKVPPLGSLQDRVFRRYMTMESQLEVEKMKFSMLTALTNPNISDPGKYRDWSGSVKKAWSSFIGLQFGMEIPEEDESEVKMREYYETVVKHVKPKLKKGAKGYVVEGLDAMK